MADTKYSGLYETEIKEGSGKRSHGISSRPKQTGKSEGCGEQYGELADTNVKGLEGHGAEPRSVQEREAEHSAWDQGETHQSKWWESEPDVGRVAHGVASRVDRLKALGNGQVPLVVARAWEILK
tara:strand:- start:369 stop:743 length:375 start_codon:yes stop_codon:yes gene_type:complete